jgi:hypothetical protein
MAAMTKTRLTILLVCVTVALAVALAPAAGAAPPGSTTAVSGHWTWINNSYTVTDLDTGEQLFAGDEYGTWTGTFKGTSYDVFEMTFAPPLAVTGEETEWGPAWGTLTASFTGTMGGKNGRATMYFTIREAANSWVMTGTWTILSGTKALKHVSGSGTWVSSGFDSSADYSGTLRWK